MPSPDTALFDGSHHVGIRPRVRGTDIGGGGSSLDKPDPFHAVVIDRKTGHGTLLVPQEGDDASVGGFLHMNEFVADGRVERLPPPAVHAQPEPPVANGQPVGRGQLIALVPAGVFLELNRGRIGQLDRLEIALPASSGSSHCDVRDHGEPATAREKTSCVLAEYPGPSGSKRVALKGRRAQVAWKWSVNRSLPSWSGIRQMNPEPFMR